MHEVLSAQPDRAGKQVEVPFDLIESQDGMTWSDLDLTEAQAASLGWSGEQTDEGEWRKQRELLRAERSDIWQQIDAARNDHFRRDALKLDYQKKSEEIDDLTKLLGDEG